ncbi:hypothetical protein AX14_011523 [Amanita brunnescens Koide BX004]|nr:hypothetical protein AX14_011523 [Amanita brunnescens Koide BX004]
MATPRLSIPSPSPPTARALSLAQLTSHGHTSYVFSATFSPDGSRIVSGSSDKSVRVWHASTGAELGVLNGHTHWVYSVAFSPDGTRIVSGSHDYSMRVWVPVQWDPSTDGTCIVSGSGSSDKSVRVRDASTGAELKVLNGHTETVYSAAFSPDGARIVSGSSDKSVRVWDASTGAELKVLNGHTDTIYSVAFSPDGTRIVSGSSDKSVRVWDASTLESPVMQLYPS